MSKKKPLSPPENLWLRPPPPHFLSFISSSVLPTTTSSFNPTELLGDVWVGMDTRLWRGRGEVQHHGQRHTAGSIQARRAGWVALNAHSGSHVLGWGADDVGGTLCESRDDLPMKFSLFSPTTLDHLPQPRPPLQFHFFLAPQALAWALSPRFTLPSPALGLPTPGHSAPSPQALTLASWGSFQSGCHRRLLCYSSGCMLCDLGQASPPPAQPPSLRKEAVWTMLFLSLEPNPRVSS